MDIRFSRSAAEARDFANQVISRRDAKYYRDQANGFTGDCVSLNIRFMGLFDTVLAAEGPSRRAFNMAIPPEVQYVAHAVAVNEHRSKFPLESINDGRSETTSRGWHIERGFVGAHADIGGGYNGTKDADKGDLSDVALNWMIDQAEKAGLKLKDLSAPYKTVTNPIIHNQRSIWPFCSSLGGASLIGGQERAVHYAAGGPATASMSTAQIAGLTNSASQPFIKWDPDKLTDPPCFSQNSQAGTVNMVEYNNWLAVGYNVKMK
jgi:hypothetical protein